MVALILIGLILSVLLVPVIFATFHSGVRKFVGGTKDKPPFEFLTAWATVIGVVAALITLFFLYDEARLIEANQNAQAYANVYQSQLGLDQVLEQSPGLLMYFERNAPMPTDPYIADQIRLIAEHKLDVIDYFFSQENNLREKHDDEYGAWILYFKRSFARSAVLCDVLRERQEVYGALVKGVAWRSGCPRMPEPAGEVQEKLAPYFS